MNRELNVGTRIDHPRYGEGVISRNGQLSYKVIFVRGGEIEFMKSSFEADVIEENDAMPLNEPRLSVKEFETALKMLLDRYNGLEHKVELGSKWEGGTLTLTPGNPGLQSKDMPIETFFHKIVMVRDRLRVLEQNINSHTGLSDEDKINLQQYITRIYGSLTSFNVLFSEKEDYFVGSKS
ncbi:MAG: hypothetical protein LBE91_09895 [Tannerella sp.]|jgi:hypothetical protein|nr:hypothetical protein [Tannerella sp.]